MATPTTTVAGGIVASVASIATAAASVVNTMAEKNPEGECQLLGPFAIFVQGALGGLALLVLVYKRWRERPQRPVKIWAFDVSKQVTGSILLHLLNLLMSMLSSGQIDPPMTREAGENANPCSFYLLNLAIDTTLGIPILIVLLRVFTILAYQTPLANPPESIQSGNYGRPPKATWWLKQSLIYFFGLIGMKLCVFLIFQLCPWIIKVGNWALKWTEGNEALQIIFVMLVFPVIMNALQYYIIDGFIKNQTPDEHESVASEDSDDEHEGLSRGQTNTWEAGLDSDDDTIVAPHTKKESKKASSRVAELRRHDKLDEYNPDKDGDESSGSGSGNGGSPAMSAETEVLLGESKKLRPRE